MTPTLSVDAVQDSDTDVDVCPVTVRFAGAVGGDGVAAGPPIVTLPVSRMSRDDAPT